MGRFYQYCWHLVKALDYFAYSWQSGHVSVSFFPPACISCLRALLLLQILWYLLQSFPGDGIIGLNLWNPVPGGGGVRKTEQKTSADGDRFEWCVVLGTLGKLWEMPPAMCRCLASVLLLCNGLRSGSTEYSAEALLLCSKFIARN